MYSRGMRSAPLKGKKRNEHQNGADERAFHTKKTNPGIYGCLQQQLRHQYRTIFYARSSDRPDSKTNTNVYAVRRSTQSSVIHTRKSGTEPGNAIPDSTAPTAAPPPPPNTGYSAPLGGGGRTHLLLALVI